MQELSLNQRDGLTVIDVATDSGERLGDEVHHD